MFLGALKRHAVANPPYDTLLFGFPNPTGSKIEKFQDLPPGLKISSEIDIFNQATYQGPIFVEVLKVEIENFKRDWRGVLSHHLNCEMKIHILVALNRRF